MKKFKRLGMVGLLSVAVLAACSTDTTKEAQPAESAATEESLETEEVSAKDVKWTYEGETGTENWHTLHPEFAPCADGKEQSPVDIDLAKVKLDQTLEELQINYSPTQFTLQNNGHTFQLNDPTGSNTIVVEGEEYKLLQMHFHIPSENTINGEHFAMEGHLVHINEAGSLAVVGFMIEAGVENEILKEAWANMPTEKTPEDVELTNPIDLQNLLPANMKSFRFSGSLTTPPCSEGVSWIVLENPIQYSQEQIDAFAEIFPPHNSRETQPLHEREIHTHD
ncbi:carbonic anhydrase [Alkalihalobacillus deserti]|uniref:carbonic anhydrase n=1 Tax=Alkalihalobacillus deserti TaxID=2879466 RepID=UPI001D138867|nr:carbonic anhydrase family protein [Alkalihalobacillus deserti]